MKNQASILVMLLVTAFAISQQQHVETESVEISNLIPFIVDHIESEAPESTSENITFLIQTSNIDFNTEDKFILKQAFKLISNRLSEYDFISIIAYSNVNGIVLEKTSATNLKLILHSIENLKLNVKKVHNDGIELAYAYTKNNYEDDANNTVIMIRNPSTNITKTTNAVPVETLQDVKVNTKNNAVLLTAISLLPQIISVIKD